MPIRHPRNFFDEFVMPSYAEWRSNELIEWKAKMAVGNLDTMAETCFVYWEEIDPKKIHNLNTARQYREFLSANECSDLGLVWDIHDTHKHIELDSTRSGGRKVTKANQTKKESLGWDGPWDETKWDADPSLVVTKGDGGKRDLSAILKNVMEMWERLLSQWGI